MDTPRFESSMFPVTATINANTVSHGGEHLCVIFYRAYTRERLASFVSEGRMRTSFILESQPDDIVYGITLAEAICRVEESLIR
jgi:hypothetical protein